MPHQIDGYPQDIRSITIAIYGKNRSPSLILKGEDEKLLFNGGIDADVVQAIGNALLQESETTIDLGLSERQRPYGKGLRQTLGVALTTIAEHCLNR